MAERCPALGHDFCLLYNLNLDELKNEHCAGGDRCCINDMKLVSEKDYEQHLKQFIEFTDSYRLAFDEIKKIMDENIKLREGPICEYSTPTREAAEKIIEKFRPAELANPDAVAEEEKLIHDHVQLRGGDGRNRITIYTPEAVKNVMERYRPELLVWRSPLKADSESSEKPSDKGYTDETEDVEEPEVMLDQASFLEHQLKRHGFTE